MNLLFAQESAGQAPAANNDAGQALPVAPTETTTTALTQAPDNQKAPVKPQAQSNGLDFLMITLPVILIFYWFFMHRPQQKQYDQQQKMLNAIDRNDKILTVGGIIGTVYSIDKEKNEIVLKVDDSNSTKIHFALGAVQTVFPKEEGK
jgi:preprotein translocase subunit YajC